MVGNTGSEAATATLPPITVLTKIDNKTDVKIENAFIVLAVKVDTRFRAQSHTWP